MANDMDPCSSGTRRYNSATGEARWTPPEGKVEDQLILAPHEKNRDQWVSYIDENTGKEYWYNVETGETSWE